MVVIIMIYDWSGSGGLYDEIKLQNNKRLVSRSH